MNQKIILLVLTVLVVTILAEPRRRGKERERGGDDKKDKGGSDKEEEIEDISELDPNATFTCFKCAAKNCTDEFSKTTSVKVLCDPGDICWKGASGKDSYRGCATRQCIPKNTPDNVFFSSNVCCGKDYCNKAVSSRHVNNVMIGFLSILIVFSIF